MTGARCCARGSDPQPKSCSTWRRSGPATGCSTSRPAPAIRRLQTAERVGPTGYVLATDISANILDFAAQNARRAGHRNIETKVLDGENLDVPAGHVRRGHLARRPDLLSGSAEGARRHEAGAQARRPRRGDRLQHGGEQQVLLDSGLGHPPPRQPAAAAAGPARAVQPRRRRRPGRGLPQGRLPRRAESDRARRRCG